MQLRRRLHINDVILHVIYQLNYNNEYIKCIKIHEINRTFVSFRLILYYISFVIIKYYIFTHDASVTRDNIYFLITPEIKYDITMKDTNIHYLY